MWLEPWESTEEDFGGCRMWVEIAAKIQMGAVYIHGIQILLSAYMHNTYIMMYNLCIILL